MLSASVRYISKPVITSVPYAATDSPGETRSEDILKTAVPSDGSLACAKAPHLLLRDGPSPISLAKADPTVLDRNSHHQ